MSRLDELKSAIEARTARIGVIGLGYVGLPLGVEFAKAGFDVTGFDLDAQKVRKLEDGESYIEDVPSSDLREVKAAGRFRATTNFAALTKLDVINICVPTPLTRAKDPDVSHMAAAMDEIRKRLRAGQLVILGSTTYPGTTTELFVPALEETGLSVGKDFALCFAPERIDPGNERFKVRNVPKVVGGETPACTALGCAVFSKIFDTVVPVSSSRCAEMVKLLENTFRAINIGLANEVALMCERLGLDVWEVIEAASTKPYGYMKFLPGPGLGGHCIPVDPSYLSWKLKSLDFSARFIELATDINSSMPHHVADRCASLLNEQRLAVNGSKILILGVAYKKDVGDMRESPALDVVNLLSKRGADIRFHDPHVGEFEVGGTGYKGIELSEQALADADLVVILTDHSDVDYARVVRHSGRVFDTRNATRAVTENRDRITKL